MGVFGLKVCNYFSIIILFCNFTDFFSREAQILIGGFDKDPAIAHIFSETISFTMDSQAWCVMRAQQSVSWKHIVNVFSRSVWFTLIFIFFVITIIIYAIGNWEYTNQSIYWALLHSLTVCVSTSPKLWSSKKFHVRILFFILLIYGMLVNMMFSCFLVTTLTKQRFQGQISTINESIRENYMYTGGQSILTALMLRDGQVIHKRK